MFENIRDAEFSCSSFNDVTTPPASRQALEQLIREGGLARLIEAGARLHQTGCNGCLGMGQAPAAGRRSLRTVTRNFPGRSGTKEDQVYLCSPETAAASALSGMITDPRRLAMPYPRIEDSGGASGGAIPWTRRRLHGQVQNAR